MELDAFSRRSWSWDWSRAGWHMLRFVATWWCLVALLVWELTALHVEPWKDIQEFVFVLDCQHSLRTTFQHAWGTGQQARYLVPLSNLALILAPLAFALTLKRWSVWIRLAFMLGSLLAGASLMMDVTMDWSNLLNCDI
jgi:hypothetical protein